MANLQLQDNLFAACATVAFQNKCVVPMRKAKNNLWLIIPQNVTMKSVAEGYVKTRLNYKDTTGTTRTVTVLQKQYKSSEEFLMNSSLWNYYIAQHFGDTTRKGCDYESKYYMRAIKKAMTKKNYPTMHKYTTSDLLNKYKK